MKKKSIFKDGANKNLTHPEREKGITLIALVITIIVLLILAGISISILSGQEGILNKAVDAKSAAEKEAEKEKIKMATFNSLAKDYKINYDTLDTELSKMFENHALVKEGENFRLTIDEKQYVLNKDGQILEEVRRKMGFNKSE